MYFSVFHFTEQAKMIILQPVPDNFIYLKSLKVFVVSLFLPIDHCKQVFCFTSSSSFCLEFSSGVNVRSSRVTLYLHLPGTMGHNHYGGSLTKFSG